MSKSIPSALATHYAGDSLTTAVALKITRTDGTVFAYTSADIDATISGTTYTAQGVGATAFSSDAEFSVGNMTINTLDDGTIFKRAEVIGGLWQLATYSLIRYNWASPSDGVEYISAGTLGQITIRQAQVEVELRDLRQYLQQPAGEVSSKTCRRRLGDSKCRVDLTSYTFTATVTSVTDLQTFTASALTQAADYFGEGDFTWLTGNNPGQRQKIKTHATGGVLTLALPMLAAIQVGDTFTIVAGCRKRHERTAANPSGISDCIDKFNNILNFGGEPHRPGADALTASPDGTAA
jgi:uncharacterized phage protein (TIGR02218 family)